MFFGSEHNRSPLVIGLVIGLGPTIGDGLAAVWFRVARLTVDRVDVSGFLLSECGRKAVGNVLHELVGTVRVADLS